MRKKERWSKLFEEELPREDKEDIKKRNTLRAYSLHTVSEATSSFSIELEEKEKNRHINKTFFLSIYLMQ